MGFSSTAGLIVILSTVLVCSIYLYSSVDLNIVKMDNAYSDYINCLNNKAHEKLIILSAVNSSDTINITLLNNGSLTHEPDKWTVLYNGTPKNFEISPNIVYLTPLNNITIIINATAPARICVVSEYGNKYYYNLN
ncbi:flagellar protein F [Methanothermococcus okinawensis]|uniref:Flagellin n=1 Tax=Methanothermococcus okinawensis (strain DSM 14208 / JCM 11175 / IH1) TaxID=647113 RepID=F8AMQ5_METOI|nr:flagellar protein F [Methanothermococcus okinawensis]AEH06886.1 flagellin [Methanothermococcus okinawensis IH1]